MITFTTGNLFESDAEALVNTVNTQGVMGKGIALQFRENYPHNYALYRKACQAGEVRVGQMFVVEDGDMMRTRRIIINFPTKDKWRNPSQYSYIEAGLNSLKSVLRGWNVRSVAMPPLGSCNGGLDWAVVRKMIVESLSEVDCKVIVFEPSKAVDERMKAERVRLTPARAMLIAVMADAASQGGALSEFAAEKMVFFLQRNGAEDAFRLTFKKSFYGPYSGRVRYVLRYLNGSYVMGMSDLSNRPFDEIYLVGEAQSAAAQYLLRPENARYRDIAERTMRLLDGFYSNYLLELFATTAYLCDSDKRMLHSADDEEVVRIVGEDLMQWSDRKNQLFNQQGLIRLALERLGRGVPAAEGK